MITGFNTDIEHEGVVYHVQTEDKGLNSPVIVSHVYVGGAILASKRAPYHDLIDSGFDEGVLAERLNRQHKLICAAIYSGRIQDLKQMSQRGAPTTEVKEPTASTEENKKQVIGEAVQPSISPAPPVKHAPSTVRADIPSKADFARVEETADALHLSLLEEREFRAGDVVTLRVRVSRGPAEARDAIPDAPVTVKVLGTDFRPLIVEASTDQDGIAIIHAWLPNFTKGRAAILIRAVAGGYEAELRRIINHA